MSKSWKIGEIKYKLNITCWNCNQKGHFQNKCLKIVASKDKEVNMTARDSKDALVCCIENEVEDRIMDSGASFHATYCKEELESSSNALHQRLGDMSKIGMSMLASKSNVPDVRKVDIYFCKSGGLGKQKNLSFIMPVKIMKLFAYSRRGMTRKGYKSHTLKAAQMKCDTAFEIQRVTRLSEAEISHLWTRFMEPVNDSIVAEHGLSSEITQSPGGSSNMSEGLKTVRASKIVEDQIKKTLKTEHSPRREAPRLHMYEDPPESPRLHKESVQWKKAINEEMVSLEKNQTCSLVRISVGNKASQRLWMFKEPSCVGALNDTSTQHKSEGFQSAEKEENLVCKLKKSLYGLKQAPRQ
nr:retrovirus-related Pol polyprotein from transposon TNT 1-94 [Tanacetum cinerariifolium]